MAAKGEFPRDLCGQHGASAVTFALGSGRDGITFVQIKHLRNLPGWQRHLENVECAQGQKMAKPNNKSKPAKAIERPSPPFSTGGGGNAFENKVQTALLAVLLAVKNTAHFEFR